MENLNVDVEKSDYGKDYFVFNRFLLICGGMWHFEGISQLKYYGYKFYQVIVFIFCIIICVPCLLIDAAISEEHIIHIITNLNLALSVVVGVMKYLLWLFRHESITKIMDTMESNEFHYENIDDFNPGSRMRRAKKIGIFYGLTLYVLTHLTLGSCIIPAYVLCFKYMIQQKSIANVTIFSKLPYHSYTPFEYQTTPSKYLLALLLQSIPLYMYAHSIIGMDGLFMNMLNFTTTHLIVLKGAFITIKKRALIKRNASLSSSFTAEDDLYYSTEMENIMMNELRKSSRHLQTIIW